MHAEEAVLGPVDDAGGLALFQLGQGGCVCWTGEHGPETAAGLRSRRESGLNGKVAPVLLVCCGSRVRNDSAKLALDFFLTIFKTMVTGH